MMGTVSEPSDWPLRTYKRGGEDPQISRHGCPHVALFKDIRLDERQSSAAQAVSHINER